jgi:manganese oxidase
MSSTGMLNLIIAGCLLCVAIRKTGKRHVMAAFLFIIGTAWLILTGVGLFSLSTAVAQAPPQATSPGNPCSSTAPTKTFNVSLINIPIFLNRFGDVVPEGRMYILDENIATARATFQKAADPFNLDDLIEPLVLRVNKGDCVEVQFTNRLNEPAPGFSRNDSIFTLPGETLRAAGAGTPGPREFAPARTQPHVDFDPANAPRASMHFDGLDYDVRGSDGTAVGNNPNSTAAPGATVMYRLFADVEGEFQFKDAADLSSRAAGAGKSIGSTAFGGFGGIIVEPKGTTWVDTQTGQPVKSGPEAIIKDPGGPDFREHTLFMHDEVQAEPGILTRFCRPAKSPAPADGSECVNPTDAELTKLKAGTLKALGGGDADALINGEIPVKLAWFAFNYRSEPGFNREEVGCPALQDPNAKFSTPACVGEETSLSSWPFGDPGGGDLVFHNYRNEPTVTRLFHSAEQETHTFHEHVHRWPVDPKDEGGVAKIARPGFHTSVTNPADVQAVSPGSHYELVMEGGAGSPHDADPGSVGDIIFHCHLYPHFAEGMWGLNRVHDVLEDGTRKNPDTTPIPRLQPLDDFQSPPAPTPDKPGYPFFVPGMFGVKAPKPPLSVSSRQATGAFPPTAKEVAAAQPDAQKPGAFFVDFCPANAPVKRFDVAAIQLDVTYSPDLNWHNPQQRIYVLQEDKQAVLAGTKKPEPLTPLLNVGDCVEYHFTNELPTKFGGTVFDRLQETNEAGIHQHMVQFDVLSSDGAANGWNYDEGADPGQTIVFRDFVQDDVRTNSFHDHFFPNVYQDSGLFGGGVVYDAGCTFQDPVDGKAVRAGTIVDVQCTPTVDYHGKTTSGQDSRSFALFSEDQVPLFQPDDPNNPNDQNFLTTLPDGRQRVPIHPAKFPSSNNDRGAMGVNYSLEPFEARRSNGPAHLFDSKVNKDPATPLPRAFAGDLVQFHLFDLSMEESHGFNLHRFRWKYEPDESPGESRLQQAQHIGMLEYFEARIPIDKENPDPKGYEIRDYLYDYGGADDSFMGAWGLMRVSGCDFNKQITSLQDLHGVKFDKLQPLSDNPVRSCNRETNPVRTPGNPCPVDAGGNITAPIRSFDVAAINKDIVYNGAGDHDPNGAMYVLAQDADAVRNGTKQPEPLVIRANKGDCIEVTLENRLDPTLMQPHCFEAVEPGQLATTAARTYPQCIDQPPKNEVNVPGFQPFPVGAQVSINPKGVDYQIGSDGANVGLNFDSTVGPGESILYRWYAPDEFGLGVFSDRGDVQNHLHHGLYGGLVIEPTGSTYLDPGTGQDLKSGQQAVVANPNVPDFRENVVFENSDLALFRADGTGVPDNVDLAVAPSQQADDPEDQGEFSIGYRNEPWNHRFQANNDLSLIFSSAVHGDPATPLFSAYSGDPVRFRVAQAVGDSRSTGFALHGHEWRRSPNDPGSQIAAFQGEFNPAVAYNIHLDPNVSGGAGGPNGFPGDYLYRSNTLLRHLPGGQWGIFRVFDAPQTNLIRLPDRP